MPKAAYAGYLWNATSFLRTPDSLSEWLTQNFKYQLQFQDGWKNPEEILRLKTGDCKDFSVLAQAVLRQMGISSQIVVIAFKDLNVFHAITVWQDKRGSYSFISNKEIYHTEESSLEEAVAKIYPDWSRIMYLNGEKKYTKVIYRKGI